jgi:hypothetical protein
MCVEKATAPRAGQIWRWACLLALVAWMLVKDRIDSDAAGRVVVAVLLAAAVAFGLWLVFQFARGFMEGLTGYVRQRQQGEHAHREPQPPSERSSSIFARLFDFLFRGPPSADAWRKRLKKERAERPGRTGLDTEYAGDDALRRLLDYYRPEWERCREKGELIAAVGGDELIARGVHAFAGDRWAAWLDEGLPDLEGLTPRQCLASANTTRRLKGLLMRIY